VRLKHSSGLMPAPSWPTAAKNLRETLRLNI